MRRPVSAPRGVTLLELVIAVAVLALGTAAAWQAIGAARRGIGAQAERVLALEVALNRAAEIRLGTPDLPEVERMGGLDWTVTATGRATEGGLVETELLVAAPGRAGARLVVWRPAPP
jgi:general secretion pathway protein I